ncbi:hypothetical protein GE061_003408 [Apolygus lucorum]|uniref:Uncharacterized protein n=1 Tax=Apolygus lucorum TaxID=248454 RepID=A0A8S9X4I5_APOLU|nr:hypothetical protein GE061_003408 [Apolygus lucorum]
MGEIYVEIVEWDCERRVTSRGRIPIRPYDSQNDNKLRTQSRLHTSGDFRAKYNVRAVFAHPTSSDGGGRTVPDSSQHYIFFNKTVIF